ncbi:MAG: sulfonate/nitrate/taurine transporter substrate-binding protein [Cellulomonas sp. 73-145]|uniref:ABC transporter substrate-binding protein n=1 Tax=Cellulomonas sp. 73-145 TaxID=1895739 RepID=UPI00092AC6A0|nr:MqnA/MqnD/SBP family protein [Cellulomonas sp. 73-145]OJV60584.1 MAG: sulfonate/nitrate/taurine transporter substrate-binding protein [Cellulomonas sp. 73-145]
MRRTSLIVPLLAVAALLAGCAGGTQAAASTPATTVASASATPAERTTVRIASLKGPTTMGLVKLMSDATAGTTAEDYKVTMYSTPDQVVPLVAQGSVDVALLPSNLAAVLYAKTKGAVQVAAVNTLGVLDVVENGTAVHGLADLRGKTVVTSGKGASPEYVLDYLLRQDGLVPGTDVKVDYRSEPTEVAAVLAATPGAVGMLPQPFATVLTSSHPGIRTVVQLSDEWNKVTSGTSQLVTGVLVVRKAFATEHAAALKQFLDDYKLSTTFTNEHPDQAAPLIVQAGIVPSAPVAVAAIPASHVVDLEGVDLRNALSGYLKVLFDADPASVGGALPGDDFYYQR